MPVDALLVNGSNNTLYQAVLLRAVPHNELPLEAIASDELLECQTRKSEAVIRADEKMAWKLSEHPVLHNESLLKSGSCGLYFA